MTWHIGLKNLILPLFSSWSGAVQLFCGAEITFDSAYQLAEQIDDENKPYAFHESDIVVSVLALSPCVKGSALAPCF